ncbi:ABC transporter permease [Penaeicola halotolerans]|uniref:ABC transporter permease n=1 Tax=Penaeicola halotolerans TaxID=2793196 RepID=UPI001CF891C7|nr:ABC transporter permease [Penaeicola halotolerans]
MLVIRLILESFRFAWSALSGNILRTILSLLGVTIGIFAIIAVFTLVDSLEKNIKSSFSFLGSNIIRVDRFPFVGEPNFPWWKYFQRPAGSYEEYEFLRDRVKSAEAVTISASRSILIKRESNSISGVNLTGILFAHKDVFEVPIEKGRYFTQQEINNARNTTIIGANIAETLFPFQDPLGKEIKIRGMKYTVIGVMKKEGESFFGISSNDDNCYIPYKSFTKSFFVGGRFGIEPTIAIKGLESDIGLIELEYEMEGLLRTKRGLKPTEDNNFELNRPEAIANAIGSVFDVIGIAGWVIGGFSILVGGFGIANIMFVSVKERTSIIGIQKSLGAKNYFILFQFLFEAVFLSLIGGLMGLGLVFLLTLVPLGTLEVTLSIGNIVLGIGISTVIGLASGIIPAAVAARLDPVLAIRS